MSDSHKEGINVYSSGITNLVTITAAGLAASTALMQIAGADASNKNWYLGSLILFFLGLIFCFFTLSGLTGQAIDPNPNIDVPNIKWPALVAFALACIGFVILGIGAFKTNGTKEEPQISVLSRHFEQCRNETNTTAEQRLKCYDALVDSSISNSNLFESDLQNLSEKDRLWIKHLILRSKQEK